MRAGLLREKVIVQYATTSQNSYGEPVKTWSTFVTRRAQITPISGTEKWAGSEHLAESTHVIRIRYDTTAASITPKHRIKYGNRYYDIQSISNTGTRDRELVISAKVREDYADAGTMAATEAADTFAATGTVS